MTRTQLPFALFVALATACGTAPPASTSGARVDSMFSNRIAVGQPGCAVGVYRDGSPAELKSYGVADVESRRPLSVHSLFGLGSVAKQFTALAALTLADQGRVSLDDDIRQHLPGLRDYGTPIRIQDLLQHTSGLRDYGVLADLSGREVATPSEFLSLMAGQRSLNFTPGTQHEYSHSDYLVLAAIIERVTGQPFGDYLEQHILAPLGMTESRVHDMRSTVIPERAFGHITVRDSLRMTVPHSLIPGGQNLYTSVTDLARWNHALAEAAAGRLPLVSRLLERPTLPNGDTIPYAFGIRRDRYRGLPMLVRGGNDNGTRTEVIRFPDQQLGVAVLCNRDDLPPGELGTFVAETLIGDAMDPAQAVFKAGPVVPLPTGALARYVGYYRNRSDDADIVRFDAVDGTLVERLGDTVQTFTYRGDGKFTGDGSSEAFMLVFTDAGFNAPQRAQFTFRGEPYGEELLRMREPEIWKPAPLALGPYVGRWFSEDVEAVWNVDAVGGVLVIKRRGTPDLTGLPLRKDEFAVLIGGWDGLNTRMRFARDASGTVTRLEVSAGSSNDGAVRLLQFASLP